MLYRAKNDGTIPPFPYTSSLRGTELIKQRDSFNFFIFYNIYKDGRSRDSSVGIANGCGLEDQGGGEFESR
jgi:hypothetical protein